MPQYATMLDEVLSLLSENSELRSALEAYEAEKLGMSIEEWKREKEIAEGLNRLNRPKETSCA